MLKYSVLLLMDIQAAERHGAQIILRGIEERLMSPYHVSRWPILPAG